MSQDQPLPFIYQFAAGAVAGVSEVSPQCPLNRELHFSGVVYAVLTMAVDSCDVGGILMR